MKVRDRGQLIAYCLVGALCIGSAFLISLRFIGKTLAQDGGEAAAAAAQVQAQQKPQAAGNPPAGPPPAGAPPAGARSAAPQGAPPAAKPGQTGVAPVRPGPGVTEISELEGFLEPFIYDQVNRRDPFLAYAEYVPIDTAAPARPLSPAQRFDLDQLHLVGIMWDVKEPKAMFMDPDSEVLILGRDDGIGNRNGYIAAIREGEVVVVEAIRKRGDIIYKTRVLRMER